jgi:hypothetical protein
MHGQGKVAVVMAVVVVVMGEGWYLDDAKPLARPHLEQLATHVFVQIAHDFLVTAEDTYEITTGVKVV